MLVRFFTDLRAGGVPVTLPEFLSLLEGLQARLAALSPEDFYYLARMALVKDERHFDRFDRVFAEHFAGAEKWFDRLAAELPADWLKQLTERLFSEEEKQRVAALGGWDKLLETLRQRLREQQGRHEGGNRWIGTAGTSPFGNQGFNPEGVRIGQAGSRERRAVKVWEARDYRNLDAGVELGTRNIKMALRRLRRFAREGAARGTRSRRHHRLHRAQWGPARHPHAAGTAQCRQAAAAARCRRLDGSAREDLRRDCSRRPAPSSSTSNTSTSTTSRMNACGRTTGGDSARSPTPGPCCGLSIPTTAWCSSAMPP